MKKQKYCKKDCVFGLTTKKVEVLELQCINCENTQKWEDLSVAEKCLVRLYELALSKNNLELAQSTYALMKSGGFSDVTEPKAKRI